MPWVDVNGNDIYYHEEGEGHPLVFLHGMSSCGEAWFQQFPAFRHRFRVIAYDSVNHGHSSNSRRDEPEPDRADELEGFLAALGIERPILAGNSMGGGTLLRWAARHPDRAAALIPSGSGVPRPGGEATAAEMARRLSQPLDHETVFLPFGDPSPTSSSRSGRSCTTATTGSARPPPESRLCAIPDRARPPIPAGRSCQGCIGRVTSPMLVIVGSLDRAVPSGEHLHQLVAGSRLAIIDGAPHNVYWEAAEEYNAVVSKFLEEVL